MSAALSESDAVGTRLAKRRIVVLAGGSFPSKNQPVHGVFVKERVRFVARAGVEVRVVSPIPFFPPIKWFKRWYPWSQVPRHDSIDGLEVFRPRYLLLPKIGAYFHSRLVYDAAERVLRKLRPEFDFELIDAHFAFPNGVAAVRLGERFKLPVVITGRGEDIARFPDMPVIGPQIKAALRQATRLIAVSREIAARMESFGADPSRITVIPNGVDTEKFCPVPQQEARRKLNLPLDRRIILGVGYRLELKGFHILIDALPRIRQAYPEAMVVIVGGEARWAADYLPAIQERIQAHNLEDHVLLAGDRPQEELRYWYSAADVLSILSSREGSPNVLMESLACGLPAVATSVGGIPDLLGQSKALGQLLPDRSAAACSAGLLGALASLPDRTAIRGFAEQHSWLKTAESVRAVFEQAIEEFASSKPSADVRQRGRN